MEVLIVEQRALVDIEDLVCIQDIGRELWSSTIAWAKNVLTDCRIFWLSRGDVQWRAHADQIEELGCGIEVQANASG